MDTSHFVMNFPLLSKKPVAVSFTGGPLSSDGGLLLLAHLDRSLRLTDRVAAQLSDWRLHSRIHHSLLDLVRQRVYQLVCGYEDANDATALRSDPAFKLALGRPPQSGADLASQPSLSRLEAHISDAECQKINRLLLDFFLSTPRRKPREVLLDFDTSEHETHGQQELALYNDHYKSRCYLPLFAFARVVGEEEEYLVSAELPDHHGRDDEIILDTLDHLVNGMRKRWPGVSVIFRADAWFGAPAIYEWCEAHNVAFAIAMPGNEALSREAAPLVAAAKAEAGRSETGNACLFGRVWYQAGSWERERQVVVKAEQTPSGSSVRFVVVSGILGKAKVQYRFYGGRGSGENRIKELKEGMRSERLSCREFESNKARLTLVAVGYVLLQQMRRVARHTGLSRTQVSGLRLSLVKIAARVKESGRRVWVELCSHCPTQRVWQELAWEMGIRGG